MAPRSTPRIGWRDVVQDAVAAFVLSLAVLAVPVMLLALALPERFVRWLLIVAAPLALVVAALVAYGTRRRGVESARIRNGLCPQCAYDLRGNEHATHCPECGRAISAKARKHVRPLEG